MFTGARFRSKDVVNLPVDVGRNAHDLLDLHLALEIRRHASRVHSVRAILKEIDSPVGLSVRNRPRR